MNKILIFSDSHGQNSNMKKIIGEEKPDLILHAGDFCCDVSEISKIANYYCFGNNDTYYDVSSDEKFITEFEYEGLKFIITHSHQFYTFLSSIENVKKNMLNYFKSKNPDVIIFGHSHIEDVSQIDQVLFINPGSITLPRNRERKPTYAVLRIENCKIVSRNKSEIIKSL